MAGKRIPKMNEELWAETKSEAALYSVTLSDFIELALIAYIKELKQARAKRESFAIKKR